MWTIITSYFAEGNAKDKGALENILVILYVIQKVTI